MTTQGDRSNSQRSRFGGATRFTLPPASRRQFNLPVFGSAFETAEETAVGIASSTSSEEIGRC